ncbi:13873_t:CDS:2 [Acaulospora colombiana]|uniref:13873_t:CDS:1 n=1 Tax=Acaulospora colombiana TaxID=27376 RepID=A0ACA9KYV3_9GLOM|nr:13873_t:CDS:2 [Acaulospora colombiana]
MSKIIKVIFFLIYILFFSVNNVFCEILQPWAETVWTVGTKVEILWSDKDFGGVKTADIYLLEDLGGKELKRVLTVAKNVKLSHGSCTLNLPSDFKAGSYAVTITDNIKLFKYSHPFKIVHA